MNKLLCTGVCERATRGWGCMWKAQKSKTERECSPGNVAMTPVIDHSRTHRNPRKQDGASQPLLAASSQAKQLGPRHGRAKGPPRKHVLTQWFARHAPTAPATYVSESAFREYIPAAAGVVWLLLWLTVVVTPTRQICDGDWELVWRVAGVGGSHCNVL